MANILFKRGTQAALASATAVDGAFYLTEDTHRLYAGIGSKIVDLNQYIKVVNTIEELEAMTGMQPGDFAYINGGNILAVYTKPSGQTANQWVQINQNTDTTYTITAAGDNASDPGSLTLSLIDQKLNATTATVKFTGTKGVDVNVAEDGTVTIEGNTYTLEKAYTETGDGMVTSFDVTLTPDDDDDGVEASTFNITAGNNIEFEKTANGIKINGLDSVDFVDASCALDVNGADATLTLALSNGADVVVKAEDKFYYSYGKNGTVSADNQGKLNVYTIDEVDALIAGANSMTYKGPVSETIPLPTTGVHVGDTYMVAGSIDIKLGAGNVIDPVNGITVETKLGDLLIATGTEDSTGVITSGLTWTYIPAGDDSQTDTTYYCALNVEENRFSICNSNDEVIGHIDVDSDGMIVVSSTLDENMEDSVDVPWKLNLAHAKPTRTDTTEGDAGVDTVTSVTKVSSDDYGHITGVETTTVTLRGWELSGAEVTVDTEGTEATIVDTLVDSNGNNSSTSTFKIATTQKDNLVIDAKGTNGITLSMEWGTF